MIQMKLQEIKDLIKANEDGTVNVDEVAKALHTQLNGFINAKMKEFETEKSELQEQLLTAQSDLKKVPDLEKTLSEKEAHASSVELKTKFLEKWFGGQDDTLQDAIDLYTVRSGKEDVDVDELFESIATKYAPKQEVVQPAQIESQPTVPSVDTGTATADENDFSAIHEQVAQLV